MTQTTVNPYNPPIVQEPVLTELGDKKQNSFSFSWYQWFTLKVARVLFAPVSAAAPASSAGAGTPGQISFDANFLYVCIGANTWKRIALSAF